MGTARSRLAAENGLLINSKRETHHFRAAFIPYGSVSLDAFLQIVHLIPTRKGCSICHLPKYCLSVLSFFSEIL